MFKLPNKNKGFTLTEMLVAIGIFSLIVVTTIGLFVSTIRLQKYNLTYQQMLDQTSYAMEYISRAIRMAQEDEISCIDGTNYSDGGSSIKFATYHNPSQCWEFFLEGGRLKINKAGSTYPLTSPNLNVTSLIFNVAGDAPNNQPKVTIFMEIEGTGLSPKPKLQIQTTVSQRNLNL